MSKIKGFTVVKDPQKGAREWLKLYQSGRQDAAAKLAAREQRRNRQAADAAVDAQLHELAQTNR